MDAMSNTLGDYISKLKQHGNRLKDYGDRYQNYHSQLQKWWLTRIWIGWVRPIASLLMLIRFSVLVALVCGYILLINDQGQEMLRGLTETKGLSQTVCFVISAFICAVVAWYWARVAFFFSFKGRDPDPLQSGFWEKPQRPWRSPS